MQIWPPPNIYYMFISGSFLYKIVGSKKVSVDRLYLFLYMHLYLYLSYFYFAIVLLNYTCPNWFLELPRTRNKRTRWRGSARSWCWRSLPSGRSGTLSSTIISLAHWLELNNNLDSKLPWGNESWHQFDQKICWTCRSGLLYWPWKKEQLYL